jgi:aquaporin Z
MIRKIVFEFVGTFMLVFASGLTEEMSKLKQGNGGRGQGEDFMCSAIVSFFIYMSFFYMGRKISGCHLNPAVTFAMIFIKKTKLVEGIVFAICQLVAGFFAALLMMPFQAEIDDDMAPTSAITIGYFQALILEIQMATIFIFIFINSEVSFNIKRHLKGFIIACGHLIVNASTFRFTGGGVNPAKSLPVNFVRGFFDSTHIFLFAPFIGSIFAVVSHFMKQLDFWVYLCCPVIL